MPKFTGETGDIIDTRTGRKMIWDENKKRMVVEPEEVTQVEANGNNDPALKNGEIGSINIYCEEGLDIDIVDEADVFGYCFTDKEVRDLICEGLKKKQKELGVKDILTTDTERAADHVGDVYGYLHNIFLYYQKSLSSAEKENLKDEFAAVAIEIAKKLKRSIYLDGENGPFEFYYTDGHFAAIGDAKTPKLPKQPYFYSISEQPGQNGMQ